MAMFCCRPAVWATLSRGAAKAAAARLRRLGGLTAVADWQTRASVCETCALRVVRRGTSYCGRPLLERVDRDPAMDGCGCPTIDKAKTPGEHCPVDGRHGPAMADAAGGC